MAYALFSSDGSSLFIADVFGVTRLALGKAVKVKHTAKASSSTGTLSLNAAGTTLCVQGRAHTSANGHDALALLGVPALGIREKFARGASTTMIASPGGADRLVELRRDGVELRVVEGDQSRVDRVVEFGAKAARALDAITLGAGPQGEPRPAMTVAPDGRFVAHGFHGAYAGRLGADAEGDEVWWMLPLSTAGSDDVSVAQVGDVAWIFARDIATDAVRCVSVTREGVVSVVERESLCAPAVGDGVMLTQPESGVVVAHSLTDGTTQRYDVSAWNAHPAAAPEEAVYKGVAPNMATRLPGVVVAHGEARWFVPWHRETAVDLVRGVAHARGLDAGAGPFRRLLLERFVALNETLRGLRIEARLNAFERHPKEPRVTLSTWRSPMPPGLVGRVGEALTYSIHDRYELATHGHRWASFGAEGGYGADAGPASLDEVRALLAWMRENDVVPSDVATSFGDAWDRGLGIPHSAYEKAFLAEGAGERMILRALMETLAANGWPEGPVPDAWATEPITAALAERVAAARGSHARYLPREASKMLAKMLARHMGSDAMPLLLTLLRSAAQRSTIYDEVRNIGEAVALVAHHHPERRDEALDFIDACVAAGAFSQQNTRYDLDLTRERVARGARHFWSNA